MSENGIGKATGEVIFSVDSHPAVRLTRHRTFDSTYRQVPKVIY